MTTDKKVRPMDGYARIATLRAYLDYCERHLQNVAKAWLILQEVCKDFNTISDDHLFWNIDGMIRSHDLSRFDAEEFVAYAEWLYGPHGRAATPGDPSEEHKAAMLGFDVAKARHQARNAHHWQTWPQEPHRFPNHHACHMLCMVADWMAVAMETGSRTEYYYRNNMDTIRIPDWARHDLETVLSRLTSLGH